MYCLVINHKMHKAVVMSHYLTYLKGYNPTQIGRTKLLVMTLPYNSKPHSNRKYIREAYVEAGIEPTKEELTIVVKV